MPCKYVLLLLGVPIRYGRWRSSSYWNALQICIPVVYILNTIPDSLNTMSPEPLDFDIPDVKVVESANTNFKVKPCLIFYCNTRVMSIKW